MLYYWLNFARVTAIYFLLTHHIRDSTTDPCFPKCVEDKHIVEHRFTFSQVLSSTHLELFGPVDISLNLLSLQPAKSVALAKKSLQGGGILWNVCQFLTFFLHLIMYFMYDFMIDK